jgi:hypothetical protein
MPTAEALASARSGRWERLERLEARETERCQVRYYSTREPDLSREYYGGGGVPLAEDTAEAAHSASMVQHYCVAVPPLVTYYRARASPAEVRQVADRAAAAAAREQKAAAEREAAMLRGGGGGGGSYVPPSRRGDGVSLLSRDGGGTGRDLDRVGAQRMAGSAAEGGGGAPGAAWRRSGVSWSAKVSEATADRHSIVFPMRRGRYDAGKERRIAVDLRGHMMMSTTILMSR